MMTFQTYYSTKKTFYYNFFPTKEEEEACLHSRTIMAEPDEEDRQYSRQLVEIRDVFPPPVVDLENPWQIKKSIDQYEIDSGRIDLPWNDVFEHVLRYWEMGFASYIAIGAKIHVIIWDVTQESSPRKYEWDDAYLQMVGKDEFVLACTKLIKDMNLKVDDEISLYWDDKTACFRLKHD